MPISNTPKRTSFGILASESGTPQWLLNDLMEACTEPDGASASFSASFVPVLPALPVTAITMVSGARWRAARPRALSAPSVSLTRTRRSSSPDGKLRSTMAQAAPDRSAPSTKLCPSRFGPRMATKHSPGERLRLSMERPVTGVVAVPRLEPPVAATIAPTVQSGSAMFRLRLECRGDRLVIGEGNDHRPDGLAGLVPLAGDEKHIPFGEHRDGLGDRRRTVADLVRPARSGKHLAAYLGGILAPRIVVGDDGEIGLGRRDTPHLGSLAFVAVAAAAEHDDEAVLDIGAQSVERLEQSIRSMGIIDEDRRTGSRCTGQIESSEGAAQIRQHRQHGLRRSAGRYYEACGNQGVGRLEGADERKPHFILVALMLDDEVLGKAVRFGREQPQALAGAPDGDEREPERLRFGGNRLAPLAVDIDDRAGAFRQELAE